jgi:hypothetical protein
MFVIPDSRMVPKIKKILTMLASGMTDKKLRLKG